MNAVINIDKTKVINDGIDLFELLRNLLCCTYISDLRTEPYNTRAKLVLKRLNLDSSFSNQVKDVYRYIEYSL